MSKAQLRKELSQLDAEQLREIILDAYEARPQMKEYFEFFIKPNVSRLLEKYEKLLAKEIMRNRKGWSKARVTVLKRFLDEIASYQLSAEDELKMKFRTLELLGTMTRLYRATDTQIRFITKFSTGIVEFANKNTIASVAIRKLNKMARDQHYTLEFRKLIASPLN